jgi:hypothetical protein
VTVVATIMSLAAGTRLVRKSLRLGYLKGDAAKNPLRSEQVLPRDTDLPDTRVQDLMTRGTLLISAPILYYTFRIGLIHYSSITPTKQSRER